MDPIFIPVQSSNVSEISYDPDTQELLVRFVNGSLYKYLEVPENVYKSFLHAPSKGKFVNNRLKNRYLYLRVE